MNKKILSTVVASALIIPFGIANAETVISFANSTGYGTADHIVQINDIRVDNVVANPFDPSHPEIISAFYNVAFNFDLTSLHLVPDVANAVDQGSSACADLELFVSDASSGEPISDASVAIGNNNTTTDGSGSASFSGLVEGSTSFTVSASGYTTATQDTSVSCSENNSLGVALSPTSGAGAINTGEFRAILTWGENPRDLDSHMTGPDGSGGRFHTYYGHRSDDVSALDVDDVTSFGPETITVTPAAGASSLREGLYRYSVYHFSGSETISTSNATVSVTLPDGTTRSYQPPAGATSSGDVWTVFEIDVTSSGFTVFDVNTIEPGSGSSSVRSASGTATGYGSVEKGVDWDNQPEK